MPRSEDLNHCGDLSADLADLKRQLRQKAHADRRSQPDKDQLSREIMETCLSLQEVVQAETILFYIDVRDEVRTRQALPDALARFGRTVVPWCNNEGELDLFHLESTDELTPGMYGILEPSVELRRVPERRVNVRELDAIFVPGVAFDRLGGRLGHGRAYYDRLLKNATSDCHFIGLAWECQVFPEIPMGEHDVFMDVVVTERAIYKREGSN